MNFFKYFPTTNYSFRVGDAVATLELTNLTEHVKLAERLKSNITVLHDYVIQDGMRPDSVSYALYGSADYTWLILLINDIFTLFDWPLDSEEFDKSIVDCYGSVAAAQAQKMYKTAAGYAVDVDTYTALAQADKGDITTAYDDAFTQNEAKRRIRIVPAEFVVALTQELKKIL
jgi:hypothetical protein